MSQKDYVSLKEFVLTKIKSLEQKVNIQISALKEATTIAKDTMDNRLAGMNEFRESLKDQNRLFVTRAEYEEMKTHLEADIQSLRESRAELKGKADQSEMNIALIISLIGVVLAALSLFSRFF